MSEPILVSECRMRGLVGTIDSLNYQAQKNGSPTVKLMVGMPVMTADLGNRFPCSIEGVGTVAQEAEALITRFSVGDSDSVRSGVQWHNTLEMTIRVAQFIRQEGWISNDDGDSASRTPTSQLVGSSFSQTLSERISRVIADRQQTDIDLAQKALSWVRGLTQSAGLSTYLRNLITVCSRDVIAVDKFFGLAASLVPTYMRVVEKTNPTPVKTKSSEWFGEVGKREQFVVRIIDTKPTQGDKFGPKEVVKFDVNGNNAVWVTAPGHGLVIGQRVQLMASVVKHDNFLRERQTVFSRCKVLKVLPDSDQEKLNVNQMQ
jgi:hypothetical protein